MYRDNSATGAAIATNRDAENVGTKMFLYNVYIAPGWQDFTGYGETNFDGIVLDGASAVYGQGVTITDVNADACIDNKADISQFVNLNLSGNAHRSMRYWRNGPHHLVNSSIENPGGTGSGALIWMRTCDETTLYVYNSTFNGSSTIPMDKISCDDGGTPTIIYLTEDPRLSGSQYPMHEMFSYLVN